MNSHDYLCEERKRKIKANDLMSSGNLSLRETRNGVVVDTTAEAINTNKEHIVEIEEILTAAGIPFKG